MTWQNVFKSLVILVAALVLLAVLVPVSGLVDTDESASQPVAVVAGSSPGSGAGSDAAGAAAGGGAEALDGMSPEMRQQLADVARVYAENARFPGYSTPLNANDWAQLNPRAFVAREAALENVPGVKVSVVLDQLIVDRGRDLPVRVLVMQEAGATGVVSASSVQVSLQRQGQGGAAVSLAPVSAAGSGGVQTFAGVLPVSALRAVPEGDAAVVAQLAFSSGQSSVATAAVRLYDAVARMTGVGNARVEGPNLVIPARFQVQGPGHYRIEANLFSAQGGEPVSHLNAEFRLSEGDSEGLLKVHAVTLREKVAAGPYVLRDIDIRRVPDQPGDATRFGTSARDRYDVRGYPLDAYSHEPWEDPEALERIEFLKKLGGVQ